MRLLSFFIFSFLLLFTGCYWQQNDTKKELKPTSEITNLLKKQVLLTNYAEFKNNRTLKGASGFLIKYKNGIYGVTARHLIGEAGGVKPEIQINDLSKNLLRWEMSPRVVSDKNTETVQFNAASLNFSNSQNDAILLNVTSSIFDFVALTPNFELPPVNETLYLIGCPYSETTCKQNSYEVRFAEFYSKNNWIICEIYSDVKLSGFSGAPLVNNKGEVLGILVSSDDLDGKHYLMATRITEIQKIK